MAYTMIAERGIQKVRKQRESALIVLANARVLESEGWQVVIIDGEGTDFDLAEFEAGPAQQVKSWFRPRPQRVEEPVGLIAVETIAEQDEAEAVVAAELAAEEREAHDVETAVTDELDEAELDEAEFDGAASDEIDDIDEAEFDEIEFEDDEDEDAEEAEREIEPAE